MNLAEIYSRLCILEQKVEKLTPPISVDVYNNLGLAVPEVRGAIGIQLLGLTTAQRTTLGVNLAALPSVKHILVYDTEDQTFYTWSGTEWV